MATAKRPGGLYYTADGTAVDSFGRKIEGAPKRPADTKPEDQPVSTVPAGAQIMHLSPESIAALRGDPAPKQPAGARGGRTGTGRDAGTAAAGATATGDASTGRGPAGSERTGAAGTGTAGDGDDTGAGSDPGSTDTGQR